MKTIRILLLGLLLLTTGCKNHEETVPAEISDLLGLEIKRPLEVVFASPQGMTRSENDFASVTVAFNQPMKALTAGAPDIAEPFKLEPPVAGTFRWKGSATVSFEPESSLPYGTEFKVTVPAGLKTPGGAELKEPFSFIFTTPGPTVTSTYPGSENQHHRPGEAIFLYFDQPIDPSTVSPLLSYTVPSDTPAPTARELSDEEFNTLNKDREENNLLGRTKLVAIDTKALAPATRYTLKLEKGLTGLSGPVAAQREYLYSFSTLGPLRWENQKPQKSPAAPDDSVDFRFNNKVNSKELLENLTVDPPLEIEISDYDKTNAWSFHSYYFDELQPNTTYTFTVSKELQDIHGQKLGTEAKLVWKTGDRTPLFNVPTGVAVLEASDALTIPMGLRNIDKFTYRMAVLDRAGLLELLAADSPEWLWGSKPFWPEFDSAEQVSKTVVPDFTRNELSTYNLDLKQVLKKKKFGFVYYQVELTAGAERYHRRGLAQVTNIGVTGKFGPEDSLFFASSLDKAAPLADVQATLYNEKTYAIWKGTADKTGLLKAPGWSQFVDNTILGNNSPDMYLFLKRGDDEAYVQNGGFGQISSWLFDIASRWTSSEHYLTSMVYSERGLYRPGEEVHLKGSLRDREEGQWTLPEVDSLTFVVSDSRDQKIDEDTVSLNEFGTFHHTLKLEPNAPTGSYRVDYYLSQAQAKDFAVEQRVSGASFRVEEFEAAQFGVDVTSSQSALVMGEQARFEVDAKWLFGAPMKEADLEWQARVEPARYSTDEYPGYDFGPSVSDDEELDDSKVLTSGKGVTDGQGQYQSLVTLEGLAYKGDANLIFEATVNSSNRRSITGFKSLPVSRGEYRIGLKPNSRFLSSQSPVAASVVTLSPQGQPVGGKKLTLELVQRQWNSVQKTDVDGRFRWVTSVEDKVVESKTFESTSGVSNIEVTPTQPGYYLVRVTGSDGNNNQIISDSSFYAYGNGRVGWGQSDDDTIELVADKPKYAPGETAKILVKNPFEEATALITYERDLILHSYTTTLKGSAPIIEVPLSEAHLPNLYVSVMLFRGRIQPPQKSDIEDIGKPTFKIGYLDLAVAPDSKRLTVTIETDQKRYGPKDEVVTKLKVTDSQGKPVKAELSVAAADVGVLNLIDFKTPDLFDTYYNSLPLAIRTAESRMDVIGQRSYGTKGENQGGGGGYNPGYRKDFKSTAVWEPNIVTDDKGEAEVRFTLPENLTTFRVMATAITVDTRCGSADSELIVGKPLILKPSTPAFVRVGDDFRAGVLAVNQTPKGATATISMESDGVTSGAPTPREIFLKAGEEKEVLFSFKAKEVGTANLRFSGQMGKDKDGVAYDIPLQIATQKVYLAHTGSTAESSVQQPFEIPVTALEGSANLEVALSSTILLGLEESVKSLLDYPYGCLEQRLSRMTPMLAADQLVSRFELKGWNEAKVKAGVQKSLDLIPGYVGDEGGLKLWPDSRHEHPFLTAQAVRTAHISKQQGYKITGTWLNKSRSYLKNYLDGKTAEGYGYSEAEILVCQASALEALTRYGFAGDSYLNTLMDKRDKMPIAGRAFLLQAALRLKQKRSADALASEMNNSLKIENAVAYYEVDEAHLPWLFSSQVRDTGLALEALLASGQKVPLSDKVVTWLLEARNAQGTWGSTANNAAALAALVEYSKSEENEDSSLTVEVLLEGSPIKTAKLSPKSPREIAQKPLPKGTKSEAKLKKSGEGRLYYSIAVSYEDTVASTPVDQGFTVLRALTDLDGQPVRDVVGGQIYKVQLSVIAPALRRYVVLRDPVPAGLSVVKTDFATESNKLQDLLKRGSQPSWQTFSRFEDYADRVLLFADALAPGEHTYEYLVRAQTPGTYIHPAAQVEEMYHPELFGRTSQRTLLVK